MSIFNDMTVMSNLNNIRSICILKLIKIHLAEYKCLQLLRYNKQIQKRLNINLDTYKDYLKIVIDIVPIADKNYKTFFRHYIKNPFYHYYLNDRPDEVSNYTYYYHDDKVKKIRLVIDYNVNDKSLAFLYK